MHRVLGVLVVAAASFAVWLAWVAYQVLCEEGCAGRPWPLVAQLLLASAGLVPAAITAVRIARHGVRRARGALLVTASVYLLWALLLSVAA
jgi:hypothetical protein